MKNKSFFILALFPFFVFSNSWVFSLNDSLYYESDMYNYYGTSEWSRSSVEQKKKMVEDFVVREGAYFFALKNNLHFHPDFFSRVKNRKRELLVNYVYNIEVARFGADPSIVEDGFSFLKTDVFVHNITFGHNEAALRKPVERTKEEALFLCSAVLDTLTKEGFSGAAFKYSDDGRAKQNKGEIGWVSWGSTGYPLFEKAIFNRSLDVFGPIETDLGYHIVYVEKERPSSFSFLSKNEYRDIVLIRSFSRDMKKRKEYSASYDSLVLEKNNLVFNHAFVADIFSSFSNKKGSVASYEKNNIVSLLEKTKKEGVVCFYGGEGFGLKWFINKLKNFSPSNRPPITDIASFYSVLRTLLLQESAFVFGLKNNYDQRDGFKKQLLSFEKDQLYRLYFKNLVNSVPLPDSSSVYNYYIENKDNKYKTAKSIKFQEINVKSWEEADKVLNLYIEGEDFSLLSEKFSLLWTQESRGLLGPFEKTFKGEGLSYLFENKKEGFVSDVHKNKDGSFSLYLIKKIYPSSYIPYEKVYSRVSSFLHKDLQKKEKEKAVSLFYKNLKITLNDAIF